MSAPAHSVTSATIAIIERARAEVTGLRSQAGRLHADGSTQAVQIARELNSRIMQAEAIVVKAETTIKRIRNIGRVPSRPAVAPQETSRAKRALYVLSSSNSSGPLLEVSDSVHRNVRSKLEKVSDRPNDSVANTKYSGGIHVSKSSTADPSPQLNEFQVLQHAAAVDKEFVTIATLDAVVKRAAAANPALQISVRNSHTLRINCASVFSASLWFRAAHGCIPSAGDDIGVTQLVADDIVVCSTEEGEPSRWTTSRYAVFQLMTERARAALRFFCARSSNQPATKVQELLGLTGWLSCHRTLFLESADGRRLAFDASRGMYMPPCVRQFGFPSIVPKFTRGSIPIRSSAHPNANSAARLSLEAQAYMQKQKQPESQPHIQAQIQAQIQQQCLPKPPMASSHSHAQDDAPTRQPPPLENHDHPHEKREAHGEMSQAHLQATQAGAEAATAG
jgi:hypothetical protein